MKKRSTILTSSVSLLILVSTLMMISYVHISAKSMNIPFYMSHNFFKLKLDNNFDVPIDSIKDFNDVNDILIISSYEEQDMIGIYDPNMIYALSNTVSMIGDTRYFSTDDYINRTSSGIVVSDILAYNIVGRTDRQSEYMDDVMYYTDSLNMLAENRSLKAIMNLYSFESLGTSVYIDFYSKDGGESANRLKDILMTYGYKVDNSETPSVPEAIFEKNKNLSSTVMMGFTIFYVIYAIVSYWHFYNQKRELSIHYIFGGRFRSIAKIKVDPLFALSIAYFVLVFIFYRYQQNVNYTIMGFTSVFAIYIIHVCIVHLINIGMYGIVYRSIETAGGMNENER